jgi:hypothetical protein
VSTLISEKIPEAALFFINPDSTFGIKRINLLGGDGSSLLCYDSEDGLFFVSLSVVKKVSPRTNSYFACKYDEELDCIIARNLNNNKVIELDGLSFGDFNSLDLTKKAIDYGFKFKTINFVDKLEGNEHAIESLTTRCLTTKNDAIPVFRENLHDYLNELYLDDLDDEMHESLVSFDIELD